MNYTIIIEQGENNLSAYCPDLPGCVSTGQTEQETIQNMKEAIQLHIQGLKEDGDSVPTTTATTVSV